MVAAAPPRTKGGLRSPARVSLTAREWDELRIDYAALRDAAIEHCDFTEPRLDALYPVAIELGVVAEQLVAGALHSLRRLRNRAEAAA